MLSPPFQSHLWIAVPVEDATFFHAENRSITSNAARNVSHATGSAHAVRCALKVMVKGESQR